METTKRNREQGSTRKGATRGSVITPDVWPLRPAAFLWTDPETGERLRVELWSSAPFLSELEAIGFELEDGTDGATETRADRDGRPGGRSRVRSSAASLEDGVRAGSTLPSPDGDAA